MSRTPFEYNRSEQEAQAIDQEMAKLINKEVVSISIISKGDYFSNLFTTPKKDGSLRTILNLKSLNESCSTNHFKMESIKNAIRIIKPGSYLASLDIRDAFYSIPIFEEHKKYLKFMWRGVPYQFEAMPNGYKDAMRVFTKILKPAFSYLRELGHKSVVYVDDSMLEGRPASRCSDNVVATENCLTGLGYSIHDIKSQRTPSQILEFLGHIFDTIKMSVSLTWKKKKRIYDMAIFLLTSDEVTIRIVARFLGYLCSSFEGVHMGRLHYRRIEFSKNTALSEAYGNFDASFCLSSKAKREICWWVDNIWESSKSMLPIPKHDYIFYTDASGVGWGAHDCNRTIQGQWKYAEFFLHSNIQELMAIKFALIIFLQDYSGLQHVRVMTDNTTAIAYINKQGGIRSMYCNDLAVDIWNICIDKGCHISAAHIPGVENITADTASREFEESAEWMLSPHIFNNICSLYGTPDIDMFATRVNTQLYRFASWRPDPDAEIIDSFSESWEGVFVYAFPPFSMIWPTVHKIAYECDRAILIVPLWTTQSWFPAIMELTIDNPFTFSSSRLMRHNSDEKHPLSPKMVMMVSLLSRNERLTEAFWRSCEPHSGRSPGPNTTASKRNGRSIVSRGRQIRIMPLPR